MMLLLKVPGRIPRCIDDTPKNSSLEKLLENQMLLVPSKMSKIAGRLNRTIYQDLMDKMF